MPSPEQKAEILEQRLGPQLMGKVFAETHPFIPDNVTVFDGGSSCVAILFPDGSVSLRARTDHPMQMPHGEYALRNVFSPDKLAKTTDSIKKEVAHVMGDIGTTPQEFDFLQTQYVATKDVFDRIKKNIGDYTDADNSTAEDQYIQAKQSLDTWKNTYREAYTQGMLATKKMTLWNLQFIQEAGKTFLDTDWRGGPFTLYRDNRDKNSPYLEYGNATGTAMVIETKDGKYGFAYRSGKNALYGKTPGEIVAGMWDLTREKGLVPPSNESAKVNASNEALEEVNIPQEKFIEQRMVANVIDLTAFHEEMGFYGKVDMTSEEIQEGLNTQNMNKDWHFAEKRIFFIEATPESVESLLTRVRTPMPPTHTATLVAVASMKVYENSLQRGLTQTEALQEANTWITNVSKGIRRNYRRIDALVKNRWTPESWRVFAIDQNEKHLGVKGYKVLDPNNKPEKYDPGFIPFFLGLPPLEQQLLKENLQSPSWALNLADEDMFNDENDQAIVVYDAVYKKSKKQKDYETAITALYHTGLAYYHEGAYDLSEKYYHAAERRAKKYHQTELLGSILRDKANLYARQALLLEEREGDREAIQVLYGRVWDSISHSAEAFRKQYIISDEKVMTDVSYHFLRGQLMNGMASGKSIEEIQKLLKHFTVLGTNKARYYEAVSNFYVAQLYRQRENEEFAQIHAREALNIFNTNWPPHLYGRDRKAIAEFIQQTTPPETNTTKPIAIKNEDNRAA